MTKPKTPTYDSLVGDRAAKGHALHPITLKLIKLAPGDRLDVTPADGDLDRERNRITSRLRTVRIETGGEYAVRKSGDRLYVVRLQPVGMK